MTTAIENLMTEHRLIEQVLGSLATFVEGLETDRDDARQWLAGHAEFFREFADQCHHGKEEDRLFAAMRDHGFPSDTGPVYVMLMEHEQGRSHVRALAHTGKGHGPLTADEVQSVRQHARSFITLLAGHIQKEDRILYPAAESSLPGSVLDELADAFESFEQTAMGEGRHERLHGLAQRLIASFSPTMDLIAAAAAGAPCGS